MTSAKTGQLGARGVCDCHLQAQPLRCTIRGMQEYVSDVPMSLGSRNGGSSNKSPSICLPISVGRVGIHSHCSLD